MTRLVEALDLDALSIYLSQHLAEFESISAAEKFSGGQSNPTFKLTTNLGVIVLRRQPPGALLSSAHAVDREARVIQALEHTPVPVPKCLHLCTDTSIIGSMFYLMEYCPGQVFWDAALPELSNQQRGKIHHHLVNVLADLHQVDVASVGLSDYGKPGNYFERQFNRWHKQYRASETKNIEAMEQLIEWLSTQIPEDDGRISLVHGDYRLDNLMFDKDSLEPMALLDWELSTLGHPFADLGYLCMQMRIPKIGPVVGLAGKDLKALGIPNESQYIQAYCERMGIDSIDNFGFYVAFSFFRLAAIVQGVAKRALDGNASNKQAASMGDYVAPLAELALQSIQDYQQK
ncbi:phosphotransferase family protein [Paraferrimonas sedimenticola]|uniref:Aminoglycoside phosphotransferase n=1 Tax=Paraferrimonas sedimenticola TaxID=375674 RepID=A0AA37RVU0_9GAMM|nr:phosphotransferase family protein [Paraferrimonas sedimenticola]GLP96635.1 aminoglycoside phosphotransferase [Paraferrimonas sedimenticola]